MALGAQRRPALQPVQPALRVGRDHMIVRDATFGLDYEPVLFELHRGDVGQRRVQSHEGVGLFRSETTLIAAVDEHGEGGRWSW